MFDAITYVAVKKYADTKFLGFVPQGDYNVTTEYKYGDWVNANGGSYGYIYPTPSTGVSLADTTHWQQIASIGGQDLVDAAVAARDAAQGYKDAAAAYAAQFAEIEQRDNSNTVQTTPLLTLTFDDGRKEEYSVVRPLFLSKGVVGCAAIMTNTPSIGDSNYMTWEQIRTLENDGWEIASHSKTHVYLETLSYADQYEEMLGSKNKLISEGLHPENIIYPFGSYNDDTLEIARGLYNCGVSVKGGYNTRAIDEYAIERYGISDNLTSMKAWLDKIVQNRGWLVIMCHGWDFDGSPTGNKLSVLSDLIDYAQSLSIPIVTLKQGLEIKGLNISVGDKTKGHFFVSKEGRVLSDEIVAVHSINNAITIASPITDFEVGKVSYNCYKVDDSSGFPGSGAGTLLTYRLYPNYDDMSYQMWYPQESNALLKRRWNKTGVVWEAFENVNPDDIIIEPSGVDASTPITSFAKNKLTINTYLVMDSSGFPEGAGILETYRSSKNDAVSYQMWHPYNSARFYKRFWNVGAWTSFNLFRPSIRKSLTLSMPSIAANRVATITITDADITATSCLVITPSYGSYDGLIYSIANVSSGGQAKLTIYNTTSGAITPQTAWVLTILQ